MLVHLIFAAITAAFLGLLLAALLGWRKPSRSDEAASVGAAFIFLFFLFLLPVWAFGAWLTPFGPALYGVSWAPFAVTGILIALLVLLLAPPARWTDQRLAQERHAHEDISIEKARRESKNAAAATAVFWAFVIIAVLFAAFAYTIPEL